MYIFYLSFRVHLSSSLRWGCCGALVGKKSINSPPPLSSSSHHHVHHSFVIYISMSDKTTVLLLALCCGWRWWWWCRWCPVNVGVGRIIRIVASVAWPRFYLLICGESVTWNPFLFLERGSKIKESEIEDHWSSVKLQDDHVLNPIVSRRRQLFSRERERENGMWTYKPVVDKGSWIVVDGGGGEGGI